MVSRRIRIQLYTYFNVDPCQNPGSQTNAGIHADPDSDPGQTVNSQKLYFFHEKYRYLK
jgi:hypothetical protein